MDVCHEYGTDNDILFLTLLNPYALFSNQRVINCIFRLLLLSKKLKYVSESKYLGFSFSDSKCDDCDMMRRMRSLYVNSNRLLRTFSHCSIDVNVILF